MFLVNRVLKQSITDVTNPYNVQRFKPPKYRTFNISKDIDALNYPRSRIYYNLKSLTNNMKMLTAE